MEKSDVAGEPSLEGDSQRVYIAKYKHDKNVSTHYINSQESPQERKPFKFKKLSVDSSAKNSIILKMKR